MCFLVATPQGGMLDDIEANITKSSSKTREASSQLKEAETSQRSNRSRLMWVAIFFGSLLAVLIGVFVYMSRRHSD